MSEFYIDPEGLQPSSGPEHPPTSYDFDLTVTPGNGAEDRTIPGDTVTPIVASDTRTAAYEAVDRSTAEGDDTGTDADRGPQPYRIVRHPLIEFVAGAREEGYMADDLALDVLSNSDPEERARLEGKISERGGLDALLGIGGAAAGSAVERSNTDAHDEEDGSASDDSAPEADRFPPPPDMLAPGEKRTVVVNKDNVTTAITVTGGSEEAPFYTNVRGHISISRGPDGKTHIEDYREPEPLEWPEAE